MHPSRQVIAARRLPPLEGAQPGVAPEPEHHYRITALCNAANGDDVERLLRRVLRSSAVRVERIGTETHNCRHLMRVVAHVQCLRGKRAVLFRIVNCLGSESIVRSVYWETSAAPVVESAAC